MNQTDPRTILQSEGWALADGWRAFHYFVPMPLDHPQALQPTAYAVALCSQKGNIFTPVPMDGFWPVPPRHNDHGACDICRLASVNREWTRDDAGDALKQMLWALTEALGKQARITIQMNLGGPITPEIVCDALGQLQRAASELHARWVRAEQMLAVYELARDGLDLLNNLDAEAADAFPDEVVQAYLKSKKIRL